MLTFYYRRVAQVMLLRSFFWQSIVFFFNFFLRHQDYRGYNRGGNKPVELRTELCRIQLLNLEANFVGWFSLPKLYNETLIKILCKYVHIELFFPVLGEIVHHNDFMLKRLNIFVSELYIFIKEKMNRTVDLLWMRTLYLHPNSYF